MFWLLPAHLALRPPGRLEEQRPRAEDRTPRDPADTTRAPGPGCLEAAGAAPAGVRLNGGAEANSPLFKGCACGR